MAAFNQAERERLFLPELINTWLQRGCFHMGRRHVPTKLHTPRKHIIFSSWTHTQNLNKSTSKGTTVQHHYITSVHQESVWKGSVYSVKNYIIYHVWHEKSYVGLEISSQPWAKQETAFKWLLLLNVIGIRCLIAVEQFALNVALMSFVFSFGLVDRRVAQFREYSRWKLSIGINVDFGNSKEITGIKWK